MKSETLSNGPWTHHHQCAIPEPPLVADGGQQVLHSFPRERSQHAIHFLLVTPSSCPSLLLCSSHQFVRRGCGSSSCAACFPCCSLFPLIIHSTSIYLGFSTLWRITSSECSEYLMKWDSDCVRQRRKVEKSQVYSYFTTKKSQNIYFSFCCFNYLSFSGSLC